MELAGGRVVPADEAQASDTRRKGAFLVVPGAHGAGLPPQPARLSRLPWTTPDLLAVREPDAARDSHESRDPSRRNPICKPHVLYRVRAGP